MPFVWENKSYINEAINPLFDGTTIDLKLHKGADTNNFTGVDPEDLISIINGTEPK